LAALTFAAKLFPGLSFHDYSYRRVRLRSLGKNCRFERRIMLKSTFVFSW
jgi:hypothetical protein